MKTRLRTWLLLLSVVMVVSCATREEGSEPDPNYDVLIASGKAALETGRGDDAYLYFTEADRLRPDDPQANFGLVLADTQQLVHFADGFIDLLGALSPDSAGASAKTLPEDSVAAGMDPGPGRVVAMFLDQILDGFLDEMVAHAEAALRDENLEFTLDRLPLSFGGADLIVFEGTWKRDDILMMTGLARAMRGGVDMLLSVDLNFDFAALLDVLTLDPDSMDSGEYFDALLDMLDLFLNDPEYPNFLLSNAQADWRMPRAGISLGWFCHDLSGAFDNLQDPDSPLGFVDSNGDGEYSDSEPIRIGDMEPTSTAISEAIPVLTEALKLAGESLWDNTGLDVDAAESNALNLARLNPYLPEKDHGFSLQLPETSIDLGGFFQNPDATAFKELLNNSVSCLSRSLGLIETIVCLTS